MNLLNGIAIYMVYWWTGVFWNFIKKNNETEYKVICEAAKILHRISGSQWLFSKFENEDTCLIRYEKVFCWRIWMVDWGKSFSTCLF